MALPLAVIVVPTGMSVPVIADPTSPATKAAVADVTVVVPLVCPSVTVRLAGAKEYRQPSAAVQPVPVTALSVTLTNSRSVVPLKISVTGEHSWFALAVTRSAERRQPCR